MKDENKLNVKDVIQIDEELLDNISDLVASRSSQSLLNIFMDIHPADIAEIINHVNTDDAVYLFNLLDIPTAGEVITEVDDNHREKILKRVDSHKIAAIIDNLDTDDATDIISELTDSVAEDVLKKIDPEDSVDVKALLKYPEDTAGGIMSSDFLYVLDDATVQDAIEVVKINSDDFDYIYHIYILDKNDIFMGLVLIKTLIINPPNTRLSEIMKTDIIYATPEMDQEEVAQMMKKYDLVAIPVLDENRTMLGRITIDDVMEVMQEEADEDLQKFAGLAEDQEYSDSIFRISRIRLPWLIIALVMELVAALVLSGYENIIQEMVIATFFIPVVMAMGGSSGTQAAIVMVRGLTTTDLWIGDSIKKLIKEFGVAFINGLVCGIILYLASTILFDQIESIKFTLVISVSLLSIIIVSTMVGAFIPLMLKKFGIDPAIATGPFVTTTNDILGLLIYLSFIILFFFS